MSLEATIAENTAALRDLIAALRDLIAAIGKGIPTTHAQATEALNGHADKPADAPTYQDAAAETGMPAAQAASGYGSGLAASGYGSGLAASGYGSGLAASGYGSGLAAQATEALNGHADKPAGPRRPGP